MVNLHNNLSKVLCFIKVSKCIGRRFFLNLVEPWLPYYAQLHPQLQTTSHSLSRSPTFVDLFEVVSVALFAFTYRMSGHVQLGANFRQPHFARKSPQLEGRSLPLKSHKGRQMFLEQTGAGLEQPRLFVRESEACWLSQLIMSSFLQVDKLVVEFHLKTCHLG